MNTAQASNASSWRRWLCATFAASLAMSAVKASMASTINADGLLYLHTARVFAEQGLKAALVQFSWPAFSILIDSVHQITGLRYENAAYTINAVLLAFLGAGFVALYRETTGGQGRPWLAMAILLAPPLTDYRAYIIRDIGYWSLSLWAILHFMRYCRRRSWRDALAWQCCIASAIAFRIEGVALAALLPLWCLRGKEPARTWLRANSLFLAAALAGGAAIAAGLAPLPSGARLSQLERFLSPTKLGMEFAKRAEVAAHAQGDYAPQDARVLLVGGVFYLLLHKAVTCLGWVYAPLLGWGLWKRRTLVFAHPLPWLASAIIAGSLLVYTFKNLFLSGRYLGLLVLLLCIPATRAADSLLDYGNGQRHPRWAAALAVTVLAMLLDAFIQTGPSKRYLREAGDWARDHLPPPMALCSDDATLMYYAGRGLPAGPCPALERLQKPEGHAIGAFLIKVSRKDAAKRERLQALLHGRADLAVAVQFANESGDALYIVTASGSSP